MSDRRAVEARHQNEKNPRRGDLELVRSLRLDAEPPLPVQADGDVIGETPLEAEVLPGALRFIAAAEYTGD